MKERLTKRQDDGRADFNLTHTRKSAICAALNQTDRRAVCDALERLAEYEDAEEQGRLVRLPCKVGDTVYEADADAKRVSKGTVYKVAYQAFLDNCQSKEADIDCGEYLATVEFSAFGNGVYFTYAEAEAALQGERVME